MKIGDKFKEHNFFRNMNDKAEEYAPSFWELRGFVDGLPVVRIMQKEWVYIVKTIKDLEKMEIIND